MNKKKDIFDKIMSLKGIKLFYPFYEKHKEMLLYLFFGGLSFVAQCHIVCVFLLCSGME